MYAPTLELASEEEYRQYYLDVYCSKPLVTHDGLPVYFTADQFDHAFFKSINRRTADKSEFDIERARRMGWIGKILQDDCLKLRAGYDNKRKTNDHSRRTSIVETESYIVVVRFTKGYLKGIFNTAFIIDTTENLAKLMKVEEWKMAQ